MEKQPDHPWYTWPFVGVLMLMFVGFIVYFFVVHSTTSRDSAFVDFTDKEVEYYKKVDQKQQNQKERAGVSAE